ncbi:DUF4395 domain-containing protein [Chloroflexota bacterium]
MERTIKKIGVDMFFDNMICPITKETVDSSVSRLVVFLNVLLMIWFLFTLNPIIILIVAIDYSIRAVINVKYNPARIIAVGIKKALNLEDRPINLNSKIFASRLGAICAIASTILVFTGMDLASIIVCTGLMSLAILDSVFNFCVGCLIYNHLVYPFYKRKAEQRL